MKKSTMVMILVSALATMATGCREPAPAGDRATAPPPAAQSDDQLLDGVRWNWLAVGEAQYSAGNTNLLFVMSELDRVEEARTALRYLEQERCRYLTACEVLYESGQTDLSAMNAELQRIEEERQVVLAGIGVKGR